MSGQSYTWRGVSFEVPKGMVDQSTLTFVEDAPKMVTNSLTVTAEPVADAKAFEGYVAAQIGELGATLPGYKLVKQEERKLAGMRAIVLEHQATSDGKKVHQMQCYALNGSEVIIVTASTSEGSKRTTADVLESFLKTIKKT